MQIINTIQDQQNTFRSSVKFGCSSFVGWTHVLPIDLDPIFSRLLVRSSRDFLHQHKVEHVHRRCHVLFENREYKFEFSANLQTRRHDFLVDQSEIEESFAFLFFCGYRPTWLLFYDLSRFICCFTDQFRPTGFSCDRCHLSLINYR